MPKLTNVLIIEDDCFIAELYERALMKDGYKVKIAIGGPEGYELAASGKYDLILLDIMIPEMTGIDILYQLRSTEENKLPNSKILITTNLDQDEATRAKLEELADGYIIKADVTPSTLVEMIHQLEESGKIDNNAVTD